MPDIKNDEIEKGFSLYDSNRCGEAFVRISSATLSSNTFPDAQEDRPKIEFKPTGFPSKEKIL